MILKGLAKKKNKFSALLKNIGGIRTRDFCSEAAAMTDTPCHQTFHYTLRILLEEAFQQILRFLHYTLCILIKEAFPQTFGERREFRKLGVDVMISNFGRYLQFSTMTILSKDLTISTRFKSSLPNSSNTF
jgi:5-carboxymethyl-2-hydroxymuconate isomerase